MFTANRPRTASRAPSFPPTARPYTKGLDVDVSLPVMRGSSERMLKKYIPANQDALCPQTQSFDDINACPDTTVEEHSKT